MSAAGLLDELAAVYRELEDLERRHVRELGIGSLLLALVASVAAAAAALPLVAVPGSDGGDAVWALPLGGVLLAVGYPAGWLAVRRLTAPHGPQRAPYRAALARREAALAGLGALPAAPLTEEEAADRRSRIAAIGRDIAERGRRREEMTLRQYGEMLRWGLLGAALVTPLLALLAVALLLTFADGEPLAPLIAVPMAVGGFAVVRVCALKPRIDRPVTGTVRAGWRVQLGVLERQLVAGGHARPGELPGAWSQEMYAMVRAGRLAALFPTSPAAGLRALPPDAAPLRRWYWRRIGPGGAAMAVVVVGAVAVAALR